MDNCFGIYALGEDFDVDAFIAASSMLPSNTWRRGELKRGRGSPYPTSGIAFNIGDGQTVPFLEQGALAIEFVKSHRDELKALGQFPGVTHFTLGLQYSKQVPRNLVGFSMHVSPWLMWHLLDVGCSLTHYVWLECTDVEGNA